MNHEASACDENYLKDLMKKMRTSIKQMLHLIDAISMEYSIARGMSIYFIERGSASCSKTLIEGVSTDLETELNIFWMKFLNMMSSTAKKKLFDRHQRWK